MRLALVNTKGGVGKTTTAVYLAAGFSSYGRTLLVDCDPQQSALSWIQGTEPPFGVAPLPGDDVQRRLPKLAAGYEHVVLDTPPGNLPIITSAVLAVEAVLVPIAPTGVDVNRVVPTLELLVDLGKQSPINVAVLLTRMRYSTNSTRGIRDVLNEYGWPVMATEIPLAESYAQAFGSVPTDLGAYGLLVKELLS